MTTTLTLPPREGYTRPRPVNRSKRELYKVFSELPSYFDPSLEDTKHNYNHVVEAFLEWIEDTKDKVIILAQKEPEKYLVLPYSHRWKKCYIKRLKRRFSLALDYYSDLNFIHLVITVPRVASIPYYQRQLKKAWKNLYNLLRKRGKMFYFLNVLEPQKDGYPHMHILIFSDFYMIDQAELSSYLKSKGVGEICFIKRYWAGRYSKQPLHYLMKYLSKYLDPEKQDRNFLVFSAFLWASRTKTISASQGFWLIKAKKSSLEWQYCITIYYYELKKYLPSSTEVIYSSWLDDHG